MQWNDALALLDEEEQLGKNGIIKNSTNNLVSRFWNQIIVRKNLHKLTQLSSQLSPKIRICFRCNMKHSEECFITYPNTSKCVKKLGCASFFQHTSRCLDM